MLILGVDKVCTIHHFQLCQNLYRYVCLNVILSMSLFCLQNANLPKCVTMLQPNKIININDSDCIIL